MIDERKNRFIRFKIHHIGKELLTMSKWQLAKEVVHLRKENKLIRQWLLESYGVGNIHREKKAKNGEAVGK